MFSVYYDNMARTDTDFHFMSTLLSKRIFSLILIIVILSAGGFATWIEARLADKFMRDIMLSEAKMLVQGIDAVKVGRLKGTPADLQSPDYRELRQLLIRIREVNPRYRYLYMFGQRTGKPPFFFMGTAPENSPDYSPPGQVYFEDSPTLNHVFATGEGMISPPFKDRWGTWISTLLPVVDPATGKLLAVFGMDFDAHDWQRMILLRALGPASITLFAILLLLILITHFNHRQTIREKDALRESEEKYRTILDIMEEGYAEVDLHGTCTFVNNACCALMGYGRDELIGMNYRSYCPPETARFMYKVFSRVYETGKSEFLVDHEIIVKDGNIRTHQANVALMRDHSGKPVGFRILARDVTDHKKAEEERFRLEAQLIQAQKMEAIGRLAGGVAHDFNNMLSVIIGNTELAMAGVDPSDPLYKTLQDILNAGERSADLTRQLLAFARKQTILPKTLDLNNTVSATLKMLQRLIGEDIDLGWYPGRNLWEIRIDPSQIDQILANLTVNARDSIDKSGQIIIETSNEICDEVYCADRPGCIPGEYVMLAVSDNGYGMDKQTQANIFEPFFTTKKEGKGTGLGLATVYGIVRQNGGFINVYSEPGKGTTFRVYFPRYKSETIEPADETAEVMVKGATETVLIVEDEEAVLALTVNMLEKLGYHVLAARKTDEAIRLAKGYSGNIDLLLTDVVMPDMDGKELCEQIKSIKPDLECLYMSGYTADVITRQGILDEGVHFIPKPFSMKTLASKIRETLK